MHVCNVRTPSILAFPTTMVSTRRTKKPRQDAPEDVIPGNGGDDYDAEEESLGPPKARRPKPRASGKEASKEKGKQRRGRRNAGRLSKLPDMSLDILYEVSYGISSVTDDGVIMVLGVCRYSLLSTQWTYCECRGLARLFVPFSRASHRGRFGRPLSITSPSIDGHLRVPRT